MEFSPDHILAERSVSLEDNSGKVGDNGPVWMFPYSPRENNSATTEQDRPWYTRHTTSPPCMEGNTNITLLATRFQHLQPALQTSVGSLSCVCVRACLDSPFLCVLLIFASCNWTAHTHKHTEHKIYARDFPFNENSPFLLKCLQILRNLLMIMMSFTCRMVTNNQQPRTIIPLV